MNFACIRSNGLFDGLAHIPELLDEFRDARVETEHVLKHEDLPVAVQAGAENCWEELIKPCVSKSDPTKYNLVTVIARREYGSKGLGVAPLSSNARP